MRETLYCILERRDTKEYHIFEATPTTTNNCRLDSTLSVCGEMKKGEEKDVGLNCLSEQELRIEAAKQGRKVCGTCVSHFYFTKKAL